MSGELVAADIKENNLFSNELTHLDMYHEVYKKLNTTGKEVSKSYDDDLKIKFTDVYEVHSKIMQTIKSQNGTGVILKINLEQVGGENYTFNDFHDFEKNNTTGSSPTQEIVFTYKYIIKNNNFDIYENYKITVKLISRVAQYYQAKKDSSEFMMEIFSHFKSIVASINVEYYDYVKARSFLATFDEWIKSCSVTSKPKSLPVFKWIFNKANWIMQLAILCIFTLSSYNNVDENLNEILHIVKFLVIYFFVFYFIVMTVGNILSFIRRSINSYFFMSYVSMNKGDANLIEKYQNYNSDNVLKSILGVVFTVLISITSAYCYDLMKILFKAG